MEPRKKIGVLILAAGLSSRMGDFKPLLKFDQTTVIEKTISTFRRAGLNDIRVVIGHRADELLPGLRAFGATPVYNAQYTSGMFSSVQAGVSSLADETDGCLLIPGDMPLIKSYTVTQLLAAYHQTGKAVIYPVFLGKRGHPPLITERCYASILAEDVSGNLRKVLEQFEKDALDLELVDPNILADLDTPADFKNAVESQRHSCLPTMEECKAFFSISRTPDKVIRHGKTVARVARKIAAMLNLTGLVTLDLELVTVGGLLHDVAKGAADHAQEGAILLNQWGYPAVAAIIAQHMNYQLADVNQPVDEVMIVFLADKFVAGEAVVPLMQRFAAAALKYGADSDVVRKIEDRMMQAALVQKKIENCLGEKAVNALIASEEADHGNGIS